MNVEQVERQVQKLISNAISNRYTLSTFIYDFLLAYGRKEITIKRLHSGETNQSSKKGEVIGKNLLFFKEVGSGDVPTTMSELKNDKRTSKYRIRFIYDAWISFNLYNGSLKLENINLLHCQP